MRRCTCGNILYSPEAICERCDTPVQALRKIAGDTKEFCYHSDLAKSTLAHARDIAKAQSHEAAESIFELLAQLSILPPEFKADYLMQARLVSGMAVKIENIICPKESA